MLSHISNFFFLVWLVAQEQHICFRYFIWNFWLNKTIKQAAHLCTLIYSSDVQAPQFSVVITDNSGDKIINEPVLNSILVKKPALHWTKTEVSVQREGGIKYSTVVTSTATSICTAKKNPTQTNKSEPKGMCFKVT